MGTPLEVSDAREYTDEDMAHLGGAHVLVRARPEDVRRKVLVGRLQRLLEVSPVDGIFGPSTNTALEARMTGAPWKTPQDRLWALGELKLPGELEELIIRQWKANDPVQGW